MSLSPPTIDPYVVLGVKKDATLSEIKSAHRKRVLKCHPDKVKDESRRSAAQDEFQRVQQAYELLSDETRRTRYDQKVRLAELRKEAMEHAGANGSSPYASTRAATSSGARQYRDGRFYEERVPADTRFFEEEVPMTEEPQPSSKRYDDRKKPRSKTTEEKKRSKAEPSDPHRAKEYVRESVKASHAERAKYRTKTRRGEASDKYATYFESGEESSDSERPFVVKVRPGESRKPRETHSSRKTRPETSPRRDTRYYDDGEDEYSDDWKSKHERLQSSAQAYIMRSRGDPPVEVDRRARPSNSPPKYTETPKYTEYGYPDGEPESSRHATRAHLRRESGRAPREPPSMPTAYSAPAGIKIPSSAKPPPQSTRSSPSAYPGQKEPSGRSDNPFLRMVPPLNSGPARPPKVRSSTDEGYSSPGTPEMRQSGNSPPKPPIRYKISGEKQDTIVVEPAETSYRHQRSVSPVRPEGPSVVRPSMSARTGSQPTRTYTYSPEVPCRFQSVQTPSSRPTYSHTLRFKEKDIRVAPEIKPSNISYTSDYYHTRYDDHPLGRRQSTY